jgi:5-methylcytosine-specific restriction endonuclease McrA
MCDKSKETKYIQLKLKGCLDSKAELAKEYGIEKEKIALIKTTVLEHEGMTSECYDLFREKHDAKIQTVKQLASKERIDGFGGINEFYRWYIKYDNIGTCCYCGVHQDDIGDNIYEKSKRGRGKKLEVERLIAHPTNEYSPVNCRLACHICNNAKSDFLSPKEFKPIAKGIHAFWEGRLNKSIEFPENSDIWQRG